MTYRYAADIAKIKHYMKLRVRKKKPVFLYEEIVNCRFIFFLFLMYLYNEIKCNERLCNLSKRKVFV